MGVEVLLLRRIKCVCGVVVDWIGGGKEGSAMCRWNDLLSFMDSDRIDLSLSLLLSLLPQASFFMLKGSAVVLSQNRVIFQYMHVFLTV